jgi:hypothetical protein
LPFLVEVSAIVHLVAAVLVDHGHVARGQFRHRRGHQVHDGGYLRLVQRAARLQVEQDRGGRVLLVAHEHRGLGQRQMHARRADGGQRLDRIGQFAFQRALVIDLLDELRGAQLLVLEQFEADVAGARQALRRQLQADAVDLVGRHQDRAAAFRKLVFDPHLVQRGGDRAAILVGRVGEQHLVFRGRAPQPDRGDDGQRGRDRAADDDALAHGGFPKLRFGVRGFDIAVENLFRSCHVG